jgi:hypothetical protein
MGLNAYSPNLMKRYGHSDRAGYSGYSNGAGYSEYSNGAGCSGYFGSIVSGKYSAGIAYTVRARMGMS